VTIVVGLHAPFGSHVHDPSIAIVQNGQLIFALEEERLNRHKTSPGLFPEFSLKEGLSFCDIKVSDIDALAIDGSTSRTLAFKVRRQIYQMFGACPPIHRILHPIAHG